MKNLHALLLLCIGLILAGTIATGETPTLDLAKQPPYLESDQKFKR